MKFYICIRKLFKGGGEIERVLEREREVSEIKKNGLFLVCNYLRYVD